MRLTYTTYILERAQIREQRSESTDQRAKNRDQRTVIREQRAESREQRTVSREQTVTLISTGESREPAWTKPLVQTPPTKTQERREIG